MAVDYREKIRKLLALAGSDNESESRSALLKARRLMAEHKLSEAECLDNPSSDEVVNVGTEVSCTARTNRWKLELSVVIAENYCCRTYSSVEGRRYFVRFVGFKEDVEICSMIYKYAVDSVESQQKLLRKSIRKENPNHNFTSSEFTTIFNSYGYGFVTGVKEMYEEQDNENESYDLVLSTPEEVNEECSRIGLKKRTIGSSSRKGSSFSRMAGNEGYQDGLKFNPKRKISFAD